MGDKQAQPVTKLFWIDLEMTGLDVEKEVIIETGAIITDVDLKPIDHYHAVVKQPQKYLDQMDAWNKKHHGESGLTALVPSGRSPEEVEDDLLSIINQHWDTKERVVLAGNTIYQDRLFLTKYFKKFSARLHYRMLDVTAWKVLMKFKYKIHYEKKNTHRALGDIEESIAELRTYLSHIKV